MTFESASLTRSTIADALNPPKITECAAILAQASIAIATSGTMPM